MDDSDNSRAKIIDFGLSRFDSAAESRQGGGLCGSLVTMAPEVMRSEPYQPSSDVYSFGIILGEMFSGRLPFANSNAVQLMYGVGVQGKRPEYCESDNIPESVLDLIKDCWAQDPMARPDFGAVVKRLNRIRRSLGSGSLHFSNNAYDRDSR
jgi:serine/threonine protein kinase